MRFINTINRYERTSINQLISFTVLRSITLLDKYNNTMSMYLQLTPVKYLMSFQQSVCDDSYQYPYVDQFKNTIQISTTDVINEGLLLTDEKRNASSYQVVADFLHGNRDAHAKYTCIDVQCIQMSNMKASDSLQSYK